MRHCRRRRRWRLLSELQLRPVGAEGDDHATRSFAPCRISEDTRRAGASKCSWHKLSRSAGFEGSLGGRDVDVRWRHSRRCSRDAGASDSEGAAVVDTVVAEGGDTVGAAAADAGASDSDGAVVVEGVTRRAGTAKLRAVRSYAP